MMIFLAAHIVISSGGSGTSGSGYSAVIVAVLAFFSPCSNTFIRLTVESDI